MKHIKYYQYHHQKENMTECGIQNLVKDKKLLQNHKRCNYRYVFRNVEPSEKETTEKKALPVKGDNIETKIDVNIYDAFYGLDKQIALKTVDGNLKTYIVKIPKGIQNGEKIRLIGQGKPGRNGGKNGDLLIEIHIQGDSKFRLDGFNINTDLFITPWEAALGSKNICKIY